MLKNNDKINYLTIVDVNDFKKEGRKKLIKCYCECGSYCYINYATLQTKRIRDCGCGKYMLDKHIGERHNMFVVESCFRKRINGKINVIAHCRCDCGNYRDIPVSLLKNRICCGCYKKPKEKKPKKKYPANRLKSIYNKMKDRCYNQKARDYKWYGLKGIKVCSEWLENFDNFKNWALNNGYQKNLTLDRIDYNGDYNPSNCRWVDMITQQNNKRNNVKYNINGELLTLSQIARMKNLNISTLRSRIRKGWSIEDTINKPIKKR